MNPVSPASVVAMLSPAPGQAVQGNPFQDVLNLSAVNADVSMVGTTGTANMADNADSGAVAPDSLSHVTTPMSLAASPTWAGSPHNVPPSQASECSAQTQKHVAADAAHMAKADMAAPDHALWAKPVDVPVKQAALLQIDDEKPSPAEQSAHAVIDLAAPSPTPPSVAQLLFQFGVAMAASPAPSAPHTRKKAADISMSAPGIEQQTGLAKGFAENSRVSATHKEFRATISDALPATILAGVNDQPGAFENRFALVNAPASVTSATMPIGMPIAELRQLVVSQDREWIGALSRDIVNNAARDNQLQFTLIPEHLGQLDVALTTDNGKIDVRLETSTAAAAQMISADQARLIEDLRQSGLRLGQFEMSHRENNNGQQKAPPPERQTTDSLSTPTQPAASSQAQGRFA